MPTLYELTNEAANLQQTIADADGEITPEVEAAIDALSQDISAKFAGIGHVITEATAEAAMYEAEIDRLQMARARCVNTARRLKDYAKVAMEQLGEKSIKAGLFRYTICKAGTPSVNIDDIAALPPEFTREYIEPDKKAILDAHKAGKPLPEGVEIKTGTYLKFS